MLMMYDYRDGFGDAELGWTRRNAHMRTGFGAVQFMVEFRRAHVGAASAIFGLFSL